MMIEACGACGQPPTCGQAVDNGFLLPTGCPQGTAERLDGNRLADCPQIHRPIWGYIVAATCKR
jgi:hypothetical protein